MNSFEQELIGSAQAELEKSDTEIEMEEVNEMKKRYLDGFEKYGAEYLDMIHTFTKKLEDRYGIDTLKKLKLYHVICGSTVEPDLYPGFDTPRGEIEFFLRNGPQLSELKMLLGEKREQFGTVTIQQKITDMLNTLETTYSHDEVYDTKLYHLLNMSSNVEDDMPFDLPHGELEKFIREEL